MGVNIEQDTLRDLAQRKQNLLLELKNYEENTRVSPSQDITDCLFVISCKY